MLRRKALTLGVIALAGGALAGPVRADTITFKNGHEVHGRLVEETDKYVIFQVGNGKLRFDKREIATFTEDADYGQRYFTQPRRATAPDNVTPGVDGKAGRRFFVPSDATPEERRDLKAVHSRIEEELAKLGPSTDERARHLDMSGSERASLDAAIANLGKSTSSVADFGALGPKCLGSLADALQSGDSAIKADAAAAVDEAVRHGDEGDCKWALGKYRIATLLAVTLDQAGDDNAASARNAANHALETISSQSQGWVENKDAAPSDAQRAASTKWKAWAKTSDEAWDAAQAKNDSARKKLNAAWRDLEDQKSWRKALARAVDDYGTTLSSTKKEGDATSPASGSDGALNPDIAKDATPEQQKALAEAKRKIKTTLDTVVGASIDERKKKFAPSSDELQDMKLSLERAGTTQRRGGAEKRANAIEDVVTKYGLKALGELADTLDSDELIAKRSAAIAVGKIAQGDGKDDAQLLVRAYDLPRKIAALLDESSDQRSPSIRLAANKALEAIAGTSQGWPEGVTDQAPTAEETEAKGRWLAWVGTDAATFARTEKLREDHRKTLTDLLKKLDGARSWKEALDAAPAAVAKAEKDLKK